MFGLEVFYVKLFLRNTWSQTYYFNHIYKVWCKLFLHYNHKVTHDISFSLDGIFSDIFFDNYANEKGQGSKGYKIRFKLIIILKILKNRSLIS